MSAPEVFRGNFTQQDPIPDAGIQAATEIMRTGRLHRYNLLPDEMGAVAELERAFADYVGARYCVAVSSGGAAMATALRAVGVSAGARVLTNAFTLAPVPGAIASLGAVPVFVGITEGLVIDLDDLAEKARAGDVLLVSHMRGHICDMDALMEICDRCDVTVIEDCAHTMGGGWRGVASGRHGAMAAYSTQTYKHMNSGEGGLLVSDDPDLMARAILLSGSYMLYDRHGAAPDAAVFEAHKYDTPNVSGRMDHMRAAVLLPQLATLPDRVLAWNARYRVVEEGLGGISGVRLIQRSQSEDFVGSSIQFLLPEWSDAAITDLVARCLARGVELKWFGAPEPAGFTSRYDSWKYAPSAAMPESDAILRAILDMRLPLTFSLEDCAQIARILRQELARGPL